MQTDYRLGATSAMVLLWCGEEIYPSPWSRQYLNQLDLSAGRALVDEFKETWPVAPEGVIDRKFIVHQRALAFLRDNPATQIVILGAGLSPTCLELKYHSVKARLYELDRELMSIKEKLVRFLPEPAQKDFHFIDVDLLNPDALDRKMSDLPWDFDSPTLIIAEGISYYLNETSLWQVFDYFRKRSAVSRVLLEYLLPREAICSPFGEMADRGFDHIKKTYSLPFITRYDRAKVSARAEALGGRVLSTMTLRDAELERLGRNVVLNPPKSSWLEIAEIELPGLA